MGDAIIVSSSECRFSAPEQVAKCLSLNDTRIGSDLLRTTMGRMTDVDDARRISEHGRRGKHPIVHPVMTGESTVVREDITTSRLMCLIEWVTQRMFLCD